MSFVSILKDIGKAPLKVLQFLGSPAGRMTTGIVESGVEVFVPGSVGIITLINKWLTEAIKVEVIAGSATGVTSEQKAAAVIAPLTPEILAFCAANGLDVPDAAKIQKANDLVVELLNLFGKTKA